MSIEKELDITLEDGIRDLLEVLHVEQEKKPLRMAIQFGYLTYVRLFIESQRRESLRPYFPYAGFPMEWTRADERMDMQQRIWQLQYQIQYCSSIVEEGHFMESAVLVENAEWIEHLCQLIDWLCDSCQWNVPMPSVFGKALDLMVRRIYAMGTSGMFLLPDVLSDMMIQLADKKEQCEIWNPSCRTGAFLSAVHQNAPKWILEGSEEDKEQCLLSQMLQFFHGIQNGKIVRENSLEKDTKYQYDLIVSNPPVGELRIEEQERFPIATRKIQLQYLQMVMQHLKKNGQAVLVVNEGTLFKFDAEMKVRKELLENFELQGVISLPAGAFLPYTSGKASILIFANDPENMSDHSTVWFYELNEIGYSLDRKQEPTGVNQIPELLEAWNRRKELEEEWTQGMADSTRHNQWNNPVPEQWSQSFCWFADRKTIRQNDYNITVGRYKPWKEEQEEEMESPLKLLEKLAQLEQKTMEQMKELIEMTRDYE